MYCEGIIIPQAGSLIVNAGDESYRCGTRQRAPSPFRRQTRQTLISSSEWELHHLPAWPTNQQSSLNDNYNCLSNVNTQGKTFAYTRVGGTRPCVPARTVLHGGCILAGALRPARNASLSVAQNHFALQERTGRAAFYANER